MNPNIDRFTPLSAPSSKADFEAPAPSGSISETLADGELTTTGSSNKGSENASKPPLSESNFEGRAKTSQRMRYEAEAELIKRKLGDLEDIRRQLGLSQRKMSQLLMVDPSAWTRWTKRGEDAPPHIYRMLQWYLTIEDKYPALDVGFWLNTVARVRDEQQGASAAEQADRAEKTATETARRQDRFTTRVSSLDHSLTGLTQEISRLKEDANESDKRAIRAIHELKSRFLVEIKTERDTRGRQNWIVIFAAVSASLLAGWIAAFLFYGR